MRCPKCRKKIDDYDSLCPYCGHHITTNRNTENVDTHMETSYETDAEIITVKTGKNKNSPTLVAVLFIVSFMFVFLFVSIINVGSFLSENTNQIEQMLGVKTETELGSGDSLMDELNIHNTDREEAYSKALKVMQHYVSKLGFSGYQSNGTTIQCLDFSDDELTQKQMALIYTYDEREIVYHSNYLNSFEKLDIEKVYEEICWVFDIEMSKPDFMTTVQNYVKTVHSLKDQEINATTIYEDETTIIKIAQFNDNGQFIIAFKGNFKINVRN